MQVDADVLVNDYLGRLDAAAARLPLDRRVDLVAEVREHIATALAHGDRRDETAVRTILERLGSPEEIVAAEAGPDASGPGASTGAAPQSTDERPPWGANETVAVLLLTVGAVLLPVVGPILGLVFVWLSARWTRLLKSFVTVFVVTVFVVVPAVGLYAWGMNAGEQSVQSAPVIEMTPEP
jgi:uncharacterized membrane protein